MRSALKTIARKLGVEITSTSRLNQLLELQNDVPALMDQVLKLNGSSRESPAQLKQDIFVLMQTGFKRGGYFVEFGAADGIHLSNTWLLEKEYGWSGILAEPARCWHKNLHQNRRSSIETSCVYSSTGAQIEFNMAEQAELSTIVTFGSDDHHANSRKGGTIYSVPTISLSDLLKKHNAPKEIDYLSIDTEGSELAILQEFPFKEWSIKIITVEHNYQINRERIKSLLEQNGYRRHFEGISKWDDWYILD